MARKQFTADTIVEILRSALEAAKAQKLGSDEVEQQLESALEEPGILQGFSVSEIKVAADLSEAGAMLMRDDYVTEVFVATCASTTSIGSIV
jgi:hypothetical protein